MSLLDDFAPDHGSNDLLFYAYLDNGRLEVLKLLFNSPAYSDLTIRCENREWSVHKAVVCTQSDYFAAACKKNFKEGREGVIRLSEDDPDVVHSMIQSFYYSDYHQTPSGPPLPAESILLHHTLVYKAADKYRLANLQAVALRLFTNAVEQVTAWDEVVLCVYEIYSADGHVYDVLRKHLVRILAKTHRCIRDGNDESKGEALEELIKSFPRFALDFMGQTSVFPKKKGCTCLQ